MADRLLKIEEHRHFVEAQGHKLIENLTPENDKSSTCLETNGRISCGKRIRDMNIRCFCIEDLADQGIAKVKHCPTGLVSANFFAKPLQGSLFLRFKAVLLGHKPVESSWSPSSELKECVGTSDETSS